PPDHRCDWVSGYPRAVGRSTGDRAGEGRGGGGAGGCRALPALRDDDEAVPRGNAGMGDRCEVGGGRGALPPPPPAPSPPPPPPPLPRPASRGVPTLHHVHERDRGHGRDSAAIVSHGEHGGVTWSG